MTVIRKNSRLSLILAVSALLALALALSLVDAYIAPGDDAQEAASAANYLDAPDQADAVPAQTTPTVDYDEDGDNYIDISTHQQLNAVRYDLDGNGTPTSVGASTHSAAFPDAASGMGCASTCVGYELVADIDLDTSGSGGTTYTSADAYHNSGAGWSPIGSFSSGYTGNFKGNQWEVKNLFISRSASDQGLFGRISAGARVESLGITGAAVTASSDSGILTGYNFGEIAACYTTGSVTGSGTNVGGLVGRNDGSITTSYSQASVTATANVGGLVGYLGPSDTVTNSYSTGAVTRSGMGTATTIGGLIGDAGASATVTASYYDSTTSGCVSGGSNGCTTSPGGGTAQTTSALQSPTAYGASGIYSTWNIDLDGVSGNDDPWNFGAATEYPTLKYGFYNIDYDEDDDGFIDIENLAQLNAMRDDINGNGDATTTAYANAFPRRHTAAASRMGCPLFDHDGNPATPQQATCTGYELVANLDFDSDGDGDVDANDHGGVYWNSGAGWNPIGDLVFNRWSTTFRGNGYTINNLLINRNNLDFTGLFRAVGTSGQIESLGITNANVTGLDKTGILVGVNYGTIVACYTTGKVQVPNTQDRVGGLVGTLSATGAGIYSSYSTAYVLGNDRVGGLLGERANGTVTNSYAAGLVAAHGSTPSNIGGLIGGVSGSGTISNNYWDTTASGQGSSAGGSGVVGKTTRELQTATGYTGIFADWNSNLDGVAGDDDPWDFGNGMQYPMLKYKGMSVIPQGSLAMGVPDNWNAPVAGERLGVCLVEGATGRATVSGQTYYEPWGWERSSNGADWTPITGAGDGDSPPTYEYSPVATDVGNFIRAKVKLRDGTFAYTRPLGGRVIAASATPLGVEMPWIRGGASPQVGSPVVGGSPNPFGAKDLRFGWQRCPNNTAPHSDCTAIPGVAWTSYTPTSADVGMYLRMYVYYESQAGAWTRHVTPFTTGVVSNP